MERIDELLEKYFGGETTLAEEKELKRYFETGNVAAAHEPYRALFDAFGQELEAKATDPLKKVLPKQQTVKRIWIKTFTYSGIAAAILLAVWIQRPQEQETYAIVAGNRIENTEYAQKYAEKKLNKVNQILRNSMKPMQSLETVRNSLEPMQKIGETKEKLDEIENKIQFK
ncbi:MAG TPA: hypothetical protein VFK73_10260 [Paludibacter sp.]|nr:hypothetical protein [Paludibacter sp.]